MPQSSKSVFRRIKRRRHCPEKCNDLLAGARLVAVIQPPPTAVPAPEGQVTASPAPAMSPVQSRLRWMEIVTRLLLVASIALLVWAGISVFLRPIARKIIDEPRYAPSPFGDDENSRPPTDFYHPEDDDDEDLPPLPKARESRSRPRFVEPSNSDQEDGGKGELVAGTAIGDSKLYGQPSDKSAELGQVRAGESVFIMKEAPGWVLVLRSEGAMLGWMRRTNLAER
jgi:hypothetical protein